MKLMDWLVQVRVQCLLQKGFSEGAFDISDHILGQKMVYVGVYSRGIKAGGILIQGGMEWGARFNKPRESEV